MSEPADIARIGAAIVRAHGDSASLYAAAHAETCLGDGRMTESARWMASIGGLPLRIFPVQRLNHIRVCRP